MGGRISGTLVSSDGGNELQNFAIAVYEAAAPYRYVTTGIVGPSLGSYTVVGLPTGSYRLWFTPATGDPSRYLSEYYNNAATLEAATPVSVTVGQTTGGVNAIMGLRPGVLLCKKSICRLSLASSNSAQETVMPAAHPMGEQPASQVCANIPATRSLYSVLEALSVPISISEQLDASCAVIASLAAQAELIEQIAACVRDTVLRGQLLLTCGNGGSATDAQHLAEELIGRFRSNRRALPAISLTADSAALTCIANDFGYDYVFSRQVEGAGPPRRRGALLQHQRQLIEHR